jgi:phage tail sheath protein FI
MADFTTKAPGVYIEEITPAGPIAGTGTSTPALIGTVARNLAAADLGLPRTVTSWTDYTNAYDDYKGTLDLPYAVHGFFGNGGTLAIIIPIDKANAGLEAALDQLTRIREVSMVCLPGVVDVEAQKKVIKHCEDMRDRIAILDGAPDPDPKNADGPLRKQRSGLESENGFGALYWPPICIRDPKATDENADLLTVPASGHIAGVMARSDDRVGVHKAPANEPIREAVRLAYPLNDTEQGILNDLNINALRTFPGRGPVVWGARTLTRGTPWRYVNVRRLVSYIEDSVVEGVRWAVFAPNNTALWKGLERTITEFLTRVWEAGGLFGRTAKEAFYVKIDEELNPPAVRTLGEVIVEIGLAPVKPAEFVILRFGLWEGGARVTEG